MMNNNELIQQARELDAKATPGPWKWDLRTRTHQCKLLTDHSGQYYVMDFSRWGMQDACPTFQVYDKYEGPVTERGSHGMVRADELAKSYKGQEHHRGFDDYIDHPDAAFIAASRILVPQLCDALEAAQKENEELKNILRFNMVQIHGERMTVLDALSSLAARAEKAEAANRWILVSDRLPENEKRVLVCGLSNYNHTSITMFKAEYIRKMTVTADDYGWSEDCDYDYDEEKDEHYVPEGWYESIMNWDEYSAVAVTDFTITHWRPLPEPPKEGE